MIHGALPRPEGALGSAADASVYSRLIREDRTGDLARGKRREVFIEHLSAEYLADLGKVDLYDVVTADPTPLVEEDADKKNKLSGFLVTLQCRTPHEKQYQFVAEAFKDAIKARGQRPKMGFFVNRVVITGGRGFAEKDDSRAPPGRGRRDRRGSRGKRDKKPATGVKHYDPVTDEPMDHDWVFEMKFDVVLWDAPEEKDESA